MFEFEGLTVLIFLIGLMIGSFLNVVALRLLRDEDFIFKRSKCFDCKKKIAWYDNIPILSFIFLKGKCRHCGARISFQYPAVELLTAVLFVSIYLNWALSLKTLFLLILTCNLIVITITDLREKVIFDINSMSLIPMGLIYNFFDIGNISQETVKFLGISFNEVFISAVLGAILGAAFFEIFSRIGLLLSGEYAFGGGDTILGAALGAWFGWKLFLAILAISLIVQVIVGIPIIFHNMYKNKEYKSIFAMTGLFIALIMSFLGKFFLYTGNFFTAIAVILASFILTGVCVYIIFKRMRETQNYTFLPFGPPLVLAGFIIMFFSDNISPYLPF